jgi:hypothetical protein
MGLRFTRRVSLFPGLRLNASRSGRSLSIGRKGFWLTSGPRGQRVTVGLGLPGLYWTEQIKPVQPSPPSPVRNRVVHALVIILLVIAAAWLFHT